MYDHDEDYDYLDGEFDDDSDDEYDAYRDRAAELGTSVDDVMRERAMREFYR